LLTFGSVAWTLDVPSDDGACLTWSWPHAEIVATTMLQTSNRQVTELGKDDIWRSLVDNAQNYMVATEFNMNWIAAL
jgi:hypothetical protein